MPRRCRVPECLTKHGQGYSLHEFPQPLETERRNKWAHFCGIKNPSHIHSQHVVCEKHFPSSAFITRNNRLKEDGKNILKNDAVPELNSPADLRHLGYLSPVKGSPVKKKSRRNDVVVDHQWTFLSVICIVEYIQHLAVSIQQSVFISYDRTSCFIYKCFPYSRIFERRLSFTDSMVPEVEVRGQLYSGSLLPTGAIDDSDKLRKLIDTFFSLRDCEGIGQLYSRAKYGEYVIDSFGRSYVEPLYRATGCHLLMPAKPPSRKRCDCCRKLHGKLEQRVEVVKVVEDDEMFDVAEEQRRQKAEKERQRRRDKKAAADREFSVDLRSRIESTGATPMDTFLGSLTPKMRDFIELLLRTVRLPSNSGKISNAWKQLAMTLQSSCGRGYEMLRELLPFPSTRTLRDYRSSFPTECGLSGFILRVLQFLSSRNNPEDRNVMLCFDGTKVAPSVGYGMRTGSKLGGPQLGEYFDDLTNNEKKKQDGRRPANNLDVWVLKGLRKNFGHVIQYFISVNSTPGSAVKRMLIDTFQRVNQTGFNVVGSTSDAGTNNTAALRKLGLFGSSELPKNTYAVGDQQVPHVFCPPHLIKNTFNLLLDKKTFLWVDRDSKVGRVNFAFVEKLYLLERKKDKKMARKLTYRAHIAPQGFSRMKVSPAAQVLSNSIADALDYYRQHGEHGFAGSEFTSDFCRFFNSLFDVCNTSHSDENVEMRKPIPVEDLISETGQVKVLRESTTRLLEWKRLLKDKKEPVRPGLIDRWLITIQSIMDICHTLHNTNGQQYFNTRQMCNDCCEFAVSRMRAVGGERNGVLTSASAHNAFRTVAIASFSRLSKHANIQHDPTEENNGDTLYQFLVDEKKAIAKSAKKTPARDLSDEDLDGLVDGVLTACQEAGLPSLDRRQKAESIQVMLAFHLTGYILQRQWNELKCSSCKTSLTMDKSRPAPWYADYTMDKSKGGLCLPSDTLFKHFLEVEQTWTVLADATEDKAIDLAAVTMELLKRQEVFSRLSFSKDCDCDLQHFASKLTERFARQLTSFRVKKKEKLLAEVRYGSTKDKWSFLNRHKTKYLGHADTAETVVPEELDVSFHVPGGLPVQIETETELWSQEYWDKRTVEVMSQFPS